MSRYRLSREADRDIEAILRFTVERWGWAQAELYVADLHATFERLADFPALGRRIDHIRPGYRRIEQGSHSVFYRVDPTGPTIMRVLHRRMQAEDRL